MRPSNETRRAPPRSPAGGDDARAAVRHYRQRAQLRLKRFRRASSLAVALTALLLFVWGGGAERAAAAPAAASAAASSALARTGAGPRATGGGPVAPAGASRAAPAQRATPPADTAQGDAGSRPQQAVREATGTIRALLHSFYAILPKLAIAAVLLLLAWSVSRLARALSARVSRHWQRAEGVAALAVIAVWGVAIVAAVAVIVGDARAVAGSIGLLGLALSWSLQGPIESFTGWLLNAFRAYYRVGDRIQVGDVFGDVFRIDVLTTTVWEAGGPEKAVRGAQPTGALVTFPNSELLRSNITNYTRDFAAVWDEVVVAVANESDVPHAVDVCREAAARVVGDWMADAAARYQILLRGAGLPDDVARAPEVYVTPMDSWINLTIRYLVPVRQRRASATRVHLSVLDALGRRENRDRIGSAYPVRRVELRQPPETGPKDLSAPGA